ncbi:hypothetical protein PAMP_019305 [Pampus punctatissimus]
MTSQHHDMAQTAEKKPLTVSPSQSPSSIKASRRYPCKAQTLHIDFIIAEHQASFLQNRTHPPLSAPWSQIKSTLVEVVPPQPLCDVYTVNMISNLISAADFQ